MNPITHILTGWCLAESVPALQRREKALVTIAAALPDIDGAGIIAELLTRNTRQPLFWYTDYHHVIGHNLAFAALIAVIAAAAARGHRLGTALLAFTAVHLHIAADLAGSRGQDGYQWPIPYLYPFTNEIQLTWSGQWHLHAWPNVVLTILLMMATGFLAWRRGYSIVSLLSPAADRLFVQTLRARFGQPDSATPS